MPLLSALSHEVMRGLTSTPKYLPSKILYDANGSTLFQKIMRLEEYYPTDCETEIFATQGGGILSHLTEKATQVIELGAGDGSKTRLLIQEFLSRGLPVTYTPIDISEAANQSLKKRFEEEFPDLSVEPLTGDYFKVLEKSQADARERLVLFLGSNIGNFTYQNTFVFLRQLRTHLKKGDYTLIGFDLRKDPEVILKAYNDSEGVTRDFNLNLLHRLNRELDAHFELEKFSFFPFYDPEEGVVKSFLVSRERQVVPIDRLQINVQFEAFETIHTESSRKYSKAEIRELAEQTGFAPVENFTDSRGYFADALWQAV